VDCRKCLFLTMRRKKLVNRRFRNCYVWLYGDVYETAVSKIGEVNSESGMDILLGRH
jgi:hypothetical protein